MLNSGRPAPLLLVAAFWLASPARIATAGTGVCYAACANAVVSQRVSSDTTTRRDVAELLERWVQLRNEGRWDELGTLLADDPRFAWVEFGRVTMPSHAVALRELAGVRGRPAQTVTALSNPVVEPLTSEFAQLRAEFRISAAPSATARGIDRAGVLTATVLFRDGRWQFLQVNFSQTR